MDALDITDRHYARKRSDMQGRTRNINQQRISEGRVYQYLQCFDKLYEHFTDIEKKEFMSSFVERVDIFPDCLPNGRFHKHIKFRFPVYFQGQIVDEISWDKESIVETVVLLQKAIPQ